jgi:hypothetical protein
VDEIGAKDTDLYRRTFAEDVHPDYQEEHLRMALKGILDE